jgi:hypothetical protein
MQKAGLKLVRTFHQPWPYPIEGHQFGDVEYALDRAGWQQDQAGSGTEALRANLVGPRGQQAGDGPMPADGSAGLGCSAEGGIPHVVRGVEALHFVQLDISVLGPVHGFAGDPPLRAGQACGQVRASPGIILLLRSAPPRGNFAMGRLPEPDRARVAAKHNGVVPAPDHHGGDARRHGDGYQVTR